MGGIWGNYRGEVIKKVLIIANLYHAFPRIPGISTYLPEFGWHATIVTPPIGNNAESRFGFPEKFLERTKIIEAPYRGDIFWLCRKIFKLFGFKINESITEQIKERICITSKRSFIDVLLNLYQTIFAYPDTEKTWRKPAFKVINEILKKENFDALISSFPFPTSHIIASKVRKEVGLPWLADFRDTWSENPFYPFPNFRKVFDKRLEKKTMKWADAFVTVSPAYAKKTALLGKKNVTIITNGFDSANIENMARALTKSFSITYTGTVYPGKQDPGKFFIAIRNLCEKKLLNLNEIEIRFYGKKLNWLENYIHKYRLTDVAKQYGIIARSEVLDKQRESQILLFFNWEDPENKGLSHLKFFEYLSAQRPILASGGFPGDDFESILCRTKAGIFASTVREIEITLINFYEEYKRAGRVFYNGDLEEINRYSYREKAREFANVLDKIAERIM